MNKKKLDLGVRVKKSLRAPAINEAKIKKQTRLLDIFKCVIKFEVAILRVNFVNGQCEGGRDRLLRNFIH